MPARALLVRCGGLAAILLLAASCSGDKAQTAPAAAPPAPVQVARAERRSMPVELHAIGNVEASSVVEVRALVGGELTAVHFTEGQRVEKGARLFTIDPRPYEVALQAAEATLARDRVLASNARQEVDRYKELVEKEYVTREQFDRSVAVAAAAEALAKGDGAAVERARLELGYCTIRAPVSGRIGSMLVNVGNIIKANSDAPLAVLRRIRPIFVSFTVPEPRLPEIRERSRGGALEVEAVPPGGAGPGRTGTLSFIDNSVNVSSGTIRLKATFPNEDDALWPGQFVDVVLRLSTESDAVVVPSRAVQNGQQGTFVFVVRDDSTVESRAVEVARSQDTDAVIAKGLAGGETVVTEGQLRLVPGAKVAVQ